MYMVRKALLFLVLFFVSFDTFSQLAKSTIKGNIPSLETVSGIWINADTLGIEPSVRNFRAQALLGKDMSSISWFASAPYSGGYHSGVMRINGKAPLGQLYRWYPYQALRKASEPTYKIASTVKMIPDNNSVMWEITITNSTKKSQHYDIAEDLIGFISHYDKAEWPWGYPYPTLRGKTNDRNDEIVNVIKNVGLDQNEAKPVTADQSVKNTDTSKVAKITWPTDSEILASSKYKIISHTNSQFIVADNETYALIGFKLIDEPNELLLQNSGGTAKWSVVLKPGACKNIRFFMAWNNNISDLAADMNKWASSFDSTFAGVDKTWRERWQQLFTPNNNLVSGCFPILATKDKTISRIYYAGPLTYLYLMNTNLHTRKRVILTGGPRWGATVTFFWDESECSEMLALVDPVMLKDQLKSFIQVNPDKYFGQDNYGGNGQGNPYVSNYWAIFQLIRSYITVTKDYAFLNEQVGGKTVLEHLLDYAYNWKKISIYGQAGATDDTYRLADFGSDPWNLLECVPTYIHIVPSFNAQYVWLMRETAKFYKLQGDDDKAKQLNADAGEMAQRVLKLYAGNGVWNALYPDGKKVPIRHVLDFMYVGKYMSPDLSPAMRKDMVGFAERELITDKWMRAQSIQDIAAKASDRPDHGPLGAYDGWPPGTIDALAALGYTNKALAFYKSVLPVTVEGNWSQSHELWGDNKFNKKGRVRIDERGWNSRDAIAGIDFSQVILKAFMGFYPDINGDPLQPAQKAAFAGTMYHVLFGGKYYTINYSDGKSKMVAE
jgi:hypothetical protein